jgi:hypothetical protein
VPAHDTNDAFIRGLAAVVGIAALTAGAVAVFKTANGTGTATLLAVGTLFLFVAGYGSRIVRLKGAGVEIEFAKEAARLDAQAKRALLQGDDQGAEELAAQADELRGLARIARPAATAYERIREDAPPSAGRTRLLRQILAEARQEALKPGHTADEARDLFEHGSDGERVYALGLMHGNAALRDFDSVIKAIGASHSAYEQYEALSLADEMCAGLDEEERQKLRIAIDEARTRYVKPGTQRWALTERILSKLGT